MTIKQIIQELDKGVQFENKNIQFFITSDNNNNNNKAEIYMSCDFTKDCMYFVYGTKEKFARRIQKFLKTGY